jgi:hypothetical protein
MTTLATDRRSGPALQRVTGLAIPGSIFLGAMLLFLIEPLIAKMILPWFGGTAGVWTVCLVFFQVALCAGYFYAHGLTRLLSPGRQRLLHLLLLAGSSLLLPVTPSPALRPSGAGEPVLGVLLLLSVTIGAPFMLLASTGPLLQSWLTQGPASGGGWRTNPYRLFALSNVGSLAALLAYPILIEPFLDNRSQAHLWSIGYGVFILACACTAWATHTGRPSHGPAADKDAAARPVSSYDRVLWLLLSAAPSVLLLAVTGHITQNVAAVPLLWIGPLAIYLLTLILCFESSRWYRPGLFCLAFAELAVAMMIGAVGRHANSDPRVLVALYSAGLFAACMLCHGELAARRPRAAALTGFYLTVATGGAAGAVLVGAVAPAVFNYLYDLPIALALTGAVVLLALAKSVRSSSRRIKAAFAGAILLWLAVAGWGGVQEYDESRGAVVRMRNFYGALQVIRELGDGTQAGRKLLMHGTIMHGAESLDPARRCRPMTYYGRTTGVGLALAALQKTGAVRVGIIGMGVGELAGYARPGDLFRFYEINPSIPLIATHDFGFLGNCGAAWSVRLGDGRLGLEREPERRYDLLVVDAFSGDAVPVHLLTVEAFELYRQHLAADGVLALHISNQFLDLAPVVARSGEAIGLEARQVINQPAAGDDAAVANWVLLSARQDLYKAGELAHANVIRPQASVRAWTDDYSNLWRSLR